jgi:ribosomal protein L35
MSAFALFSTARQAILSSPRFFSSSATLWYPKLKTHSGSKKRWRALASGAFKRVSSVLSVLSPDYNVFFPFPFCQAHSGHSHLNVSKRPGRKNRLSLTAYSSPPQTAKLKKLMPYGS